MSPDSNDWRLAVQHDYLKGLTWMWKAYRRPAQDSDYDQCSFCWGKVHGAGSF